jgi:hypothetical protein
VKLLDLLFQGKNPQEEFQHGVFVYIRLSDDDMGDGEQDDAIYALQEELTKLIETAAIGEFDGDEWGGGYCQLFMYGTSADKIFDAISPMLLGNTELPITHAVKRYGPPGAQEQVVRFRAGGRDA